MASIRGRIGENNEKSNLYKGKSMNDSRFVNKNLRLSTVIIMEGGNIYD